MTRHRIAGAGASLLCLSILVGGCGKKKDQTPPDGKNPQQVALPQYPTGDAAVAAKAEAVKRLKRIALAMHNFEATNGYFPSGVIGPGNQHGLSWRVQLLPYLEQGELFKQFKLDEAWDSPNNKPLIAKMPKEFESPGRPADAGKTYVQSFFGDRSLLRPLIESAGGGPGRIPKVAAGTIQRGWRVSDIRDGTVNTMFATEALDAVEWTKPEDLGFESNGRGMPPLPPMGGVFKDGFHGLMGDGSVHFFPKTLDEKSVGAMLTINGGEMLPENVTDILRPKKAK